MNFRHVRRRQVQRLVELPFGEYDSYATCSITWVGTVRVHEYCRRIPAGRYGLTIGGLPCTRRGDTSSGKYDVGGPCRWSRYWVCPHRASAAGAFPLSRYQDSYRRAGQPCATPPKLHQAVVWLLGNHTRFHWVVMGSFSFDRQRSSSLRIAVRIRVWQ